MFKIDIKKIREKYWIREDRERLFLSGVMITCMVASVVTIYWHYFDMTEMKPKIKLKGNLTKKELYERLKYMDYVVPLDKGTTKYYRINEYVKPPLEHE